jgi:Alginate lyase
MRLAIYFLLLALPLPAFSSARPATLELDGAFLAHIKAHPNPAILDAVRKEADKAMTVGPYSVMDKKETPPSGDKHDYMSLAPYWWPNPATPNGLPYIRHDGEVNPDRYKVTDDREFNEVQNAVQALGLGYYLTGNEAYAARAVLLLRTWFLDPATRMNPNLNYAQAVLGINTGRGIGLIDVRGLPRLLDGVTLLSDSRALTQQDESGLRKWFSNYLNWLETSKNGHDESNAKNNHGSWFDEQITGIALFLGDKDLSRKVDETAKTKRIALQIEPDGSEPLELTRTKSFSYSVFNLTALEWLAVEARHAGVDLWSYRSPQGASIRTDLDYLLPYAEGRKQWTHKAINGVDGGSLVVPLLLAAINDHNSSYLAAAQKLENHSGAETMLLLAEAEQVLSPHDKSASHPANTP